VGVAFLVLFALVTAYQVIDLVVAPA